MQTNLSFSVNRLTNISLNNCILEQHTVPVVISKLFLTIHRTPLLALEKTYTSLLLTYNH